MPGGAAWAQRALGAWGVTAGLVLAAPAWAADGAPAPCRTPCLAVPPAAAEAPPRPEAPPLRAERKAATAKARPPAPPATGPTAVVSAGKAPLSRRCADIMMRAQVGEPVSDRDMEHLRNEC